MLGESAVMLWLCECLSSFMLEKPTDYCMTHEEGRGLGADDRMKEVHFYVCSLHTCPKRGLHDHTHATAGVVANYG